MSYPPIAFAPFDWVAITASSHAQAAAYESGLKGRQPVWAANILVTPDLRDRRTGSGIATVHALREIARRIGGKHPFRSQRILVLHSGGDSRRLPAFAPLGKIMLEPTATSKRMLDFILSDLAGIKTPDEGRVIVATGDVLLGLREHSITLNRPGVTAIGAWLDADRASRHGVFVTDRSRRITSVLQKPQCDDAAAHGAVRGDGRMLVDTGVFAFDEAATTALLKAFGVVLGSGKSAATPGSLYAQALRGRGPAVDFYTHVAASLTGAPNTGLDGLRKIPFQAHELHTCRFFHVGSTRELLEHVHDPAARAFCLPRELRSPIPALVVTRATIGARGRVRLAGERALVDGSRITSSLTLRGENVVIGWPEDSGPADIARSWCAAWFPFARSRWACVLHGLDDDFKSASGAGATLGGAPLADRIDSWFDDPRAAFDAAADRTLWTARLWPIGSPRAVWRLVSWMMRPRARPSRAWRMSRRVSMATIASSCDAARLAATRRHLGLICDQLNELGPRGPGCRVDKSAIAESASSPTDSAHSVRFMYALIARTRAEEQEQHLPPMYGALHAIQRGRGDSRARAFESIRRKVLGSSGPVGFPTTELVGGRSFVATAPARIDLMGGWTDTPPIYWDMGGAVVNAAVSLDGARPIMASARRIDEPIVRITSVDLGLSAVLDSGAGALDCSDPADWRSLAIGALRVAGFIPNHARDLASRLECIGGGIDLRMHAAVPKGSGLGTSSILGATVLAALGALGGAVPAHDNLVMRALELEQLMTTGGGWQDQVGGLYPGIKFSKYESCYPATFVTTIALRPEIAPLFERRAVLLYTGIRRLARGILQNVVWDYIMGSPRCHSAVDGLQRGAHAMRASLESANTDEFLEGIRTYSMLKQQIDPGSITPRIAAIIDGARSFTAAHLMPGAGGGGFLLFFSKSEDAAMDLRQRLKDRPPNRYASVHDFAIDNEGLRVSTINDS